MKCVRWWTMDISCLPQWDTGMMVCMYVVKETNDIFGSKRMINIAFCDLRWIRVNTLSCIVLCPVQLLPLGSHRTYRQGIALNRSEKALSPNNKSEKVYLKFSLHGHKAFSDRLKPISVVTPLLYVLSFVRNNLC